MAYSLLGSELELHSLSESLLLITFFLLRRNLEYNYSYKTDAAVNSRNDIIFLSIQTSITLYLYCLCNMYFNIH